MSYEWDILDCILCEQGAHTVCINIYIFISPLKRQLELNSEKHITNYGTKSCANEQLKLVKDDLGYLAHVDDQGYQAHVDDQGYQAHVALAHVNDTESQWWHWRAVMLSVKNVFAVL